MPIAERNSATAPKLSESSTGERRLTSDFSIRASIVCDVEDRQLAIELPSTPRARLLDSDSRIAGGLHGEGQAARRVLRHRKVVRAHRSACLR